MSLALLIFCSLITCCVGCLAGYHGKLAFDGVTTNEEIRGKFSNGNQNPYDEGDFELSALNNEGLRKTVIYPDLKNTAIVTSTQNVYYEL